MAAIKINFELCSNNLPVRLGNFTGRIINSNHELKWRVYNEQAGDDYVLEQKSNIADKFNKVYNKTATADKTINQYIAQIKAPADPETFYRLKITSITGAVTYSPIVLLSNNIKNTFKAFVSQNNLYIRYPLNARSVAIYTADGKLINKKNITSNSNLLVLPMHSYHHGTFLIKLQMPNNVLVNKVMY